MQTLSSTIRDAIRRLGGSGPYLDLWELEIDANATARTRLACVLYEEPVTFDGITFYPFPVQRQPITQESGGSLPESGVSISNVSRQAATWASTGEGFRGRPQSLRVVHAAHLDSTEHILARFNWTADAVHIDVDQISLDLRSQSWFDLEVPHNRFGRDRCGWSEFKGAGCGYQGPESTCNRTYAQCVAYGDAEVAAGLQRRHPMNFRAFPGIASGVSR